MPPRQGVVALAALCLPAACLAIGPGQSAACPQPLVTNPISGANVSAPAVVTDLGTACGKLTQWRDKEIEAFFGLRYAQPPLGQLRFTKAVVVTPADPGPGW